MNKKATITLDFVLSLGVLALLSPLLFNHSFSMLENTEELSLKLKAETLAMQIGSAINHFKAIQPQGVKDKLVLNLHAELEETQSRLAPSCTVTVGPSNVTVSITFTGKWSNTQKTVNATYPTVALTSQVVKLCRTGVLTINQNMEAS